MRTPHMMTWLGRSGQQDGLMIGGTSAIRSLIDVHGAGVICRSNLGLE